MKTKQQQQKNCYKVICYCFSWKIHCASTVLEVVEAIDDCAAGVWGWEGFWGGGGGDGGWTCVEEKESEFLCNRQRKEPAWVVGEQTQVFPPPPMESVDGDLFIEGHEFTSFWAARGWDTCSGPDEQWWTCDELMASPYNPPETERSTEKIEQKPPEN